jgi:hypothetical protein
MSGYKYFVQERMIKIMSIMQSGKWEGLILSEYEYSDLEDDMWLLCEELGLSKYTKDLWEDMAEERKERYKGKLVEEKRQEKERKMAEEMEERKMAEEEEESEEESDEESEEED